MKVDLPLNSCAKTWKLKEGITTSLLTLPTKLMVSPLGREGVTKGRVDYFEDLTLKRLWNYLGRYNKDGSVGLQIRSQEDLPTRDEIAAKQKETEEALEEGDLVL